MVTKSTLAGALAALVLFATVIFSLCEQEAEQQRRVPLEDWESAAAAIRAEIGSNDAIRVEPSWLDTPRVYLDGLTFELSQEPRRELLDGFDRVWVLVAYGRTEEVKAAMPEVYTLDKEERFGAVDLLRYEIPASAQPAYDFLQHVSEAKVRRVPEKGRIEECKLWRDDAWHCGQVNAYLYVGARLKDINSEPRYCIYAPPGPDNSWLEIEFDQVPLSDRIVGRVGMDNLALRSERGSDTEFELHVDGEKRVSVRVPPREPAFLPFEGKTEAGPAKVLFRIRAKDFFDRFLCFTAQVPGEE